MQSNRVLWDVDVNNTDREQTIIFVLSFTCNARVQSLAFTNGNFDDGPKKDINCFANLALIKQEELTADWVAVPPIKQSWRVPPGLSKNILMMLDGTFFATWCCNGERLFPLLASIR